MLLIVIIAFFAFANTFISYLQDNSNKKVNIVKIWNNGDYEKVLTLSEKALEKNPMDSEALAFAGLSSYNKAFYSIEYELKHSYLEQSIFYLRRRLIDTSNNQFNAEIYYTLGKAYYSKGKEYANLSLKYLNLAKSLGYSSVIMSQYFGLVNIELGNIEEGVNNFLEADGEKRSDEFYLSLAKAFANVNQFAKSEKYYTRVIKDGKNDDMVDEAVFNLGMLYLDFKNYDKARDMFAKFLEKYPKHSMAHFNLGEVFYFSGNLIEAKKEWQTASGLDPSNDDAIARLRD